MLVASVRRTWESENRLSCPVSPAQEREVVLLVPSRDREAQTRCRREYVLRGGDGGGSGRSRRSIRHRGESGAGVNKRESRGEGPYRARSVVLWSFAPVSRRVGSGRTGLRGAHPTPGRPALRNGVGAARSRPGFLGRRDESPARRDKSAPRKGGALDDSVGLSLSLP